MRGFIDGEYQDGEIRGLVFLCGMRRMGKTTEMARLLSACLGGFLFFDTQSKHGDVIPGCVIFSDPGPLEAYLRVNRGRRFRVVYQPMRGKLDWHYRKVCALVLAFGWMIFGTDELDKLCGPRWGDTRMCPELNELVNYGAHHRVSMLAAARRPTAIPLAFRAESEMRVFRLQDDDCIEYFQKQIGKDQAARVRSLPKFSYLQFVPDGEPVLRGGVRNSL